MLRPSARGSLSDRVLASMRAARAEPGLERLPPDDDEDAQLTLWCLYQLHYTGFEDVPDNLEWDPILLATRRALETRFESELRRDFVPPSGGDDLASSLFAYVDGHDGPSIASFVQKTASHEQVLELLRVRSVYHLKEADPVAWLVPRVPVRVQAALMALQYDEYGAGDPNALHAHLFALGMRACGLDPDEIKNVDVAPVEVLAQNNAMSLFGLHRRLRAAALGHLAAFEATSSVPSRRMAQGLRRLSFPAEMVRYYDEHVTADAVHEQVAVRDICVALAQDDPTLVDEIFLGAFTCLELEARTARRLLRDWEAEL